MLADGPEKGSEVACNCILPFGPCFLCEMCSDRRSCVPWKGCAKLSVAKTVGDNAKEGQRGAHRCESASLAIA